MSRVLVTNCPNCGAPLKDGKCLYCDTHVRLANELDVDFNGKPTEVMLNIKKGDEIILLPLVGRIQSIEMTHDCVSYYADGASYLCRGHLSEVELIFRGYVEREVN
jgi:hypothetical protein